MHACCRRDNFVEAKFMPPTLPNSNDYRTYTSALRTRYQLIQKFVAARNTAGGERRGRRTKDCVCREYQVKIDDCGKATVVK